MIYVEFDTNVWLNLLRFQEHRLFDKIIQLYEENRCTFVTTQVVIDEVHNNYENKKKRFILKLKISKKILTL